MADPRIVDNPQPVSVITYKELRELAYLGAAVMHEDAMFPLTKLEIPMNIRNTNAPEDAGTLIVKNADYFKSNFDISGISGKRGYVSMIIEKDKLNETPSARERILKMFGENGIKISSILSGIDSLNIVVSEKQSENVTDVLGSMAKKIEEELVAKVTVSGGLALIGIVGRNLSSSPAVAVRAMSALAERQINMRLVDHGSGKINIILGVDEKDYENSIKAVYNQFTQKRQ